MPNIDKLFRSTANALFVAACLILALQATASRMLNIDERRIPSPGLHKIPLELGKWKANGEESLDRNVTLYLKPDEYILRDYVDQTAGTSINVFVAYFKSLQNTYGPHSPRICLPGNGWLVRSSKIESVRVPQHTEPIPLNEYQLDKSGNRILVLYWYQNDRSIWAEEFQAKLRLLPDLIRYKRADVSLVRLVTTLHGDAISNELAASLDLTRLVFPKLVDCFGAQTRQK